MNSVAEVIAALRYEPERFRFLIRFGVAGAIAIVAWDQLGGLVLPVFAVVAVGALLILAYAGVLTMVIARAVQAASRWQFESASLSQKLMTQQRRLEDEDVAGVSQTEVESTFHQAYFLIRLDEELKRARRDGLRMSLVCVDVALPGHQASKEVVEAICYDVAHLAASQSRVVPLVTSLSQTVFAFCMPGIDGEEARSFARKLLQYLGHYWCHYGIASYPADATDATPLLEKAWDACQAARGTARKASLGYAAVS